MNESYELPLVDWITASSIGPPGRRTFYLQLRSGGRLVAFLVEKEQVRALSMLLQELLEGLGVTVTPDDAVIDEMELVGPVEPEWRVGRMSVGRTPDGDRFLIEADAAAEDPDDAARLRAGFSREQAVKLAAYAAYVVEAGGRERCQVCEGLKDPVTGCFGCPATNGHGPRRM